MVSLRKLIAALATVSAVVAQSASGLQDDAPPYIRLSKDDAVLLIVDLQVGLASLARDWDATHFRQSLWAHAGLGKLFKIPVVMTTSTEKGPNGPLPKEFLETYPDTSVISRPGQINAWDNEDFRDAVRATNRSQVIIAGITTDVCVTHLALSMRAAGYHVAVNLEASGTFNERVADHSLHRMQAAGVQIMGLFSIAGELFRDWRTESPNAEEVIRFFDRYLPEESFVARSHAAAILDGEMVAGQERLVTVNETETLPPIY